jgi:hypothetical protein
VNPKTGQRTKADLDALPVDRLAMIQQVTELMDYVKQLLVAIEEDIE